MRTRRSRFFVLLLHVVGVSQRWNTDIDTDDDNTVYQTPTTMIMGVEPNNSNNNSMLKNMALQYIDYYQELSQLLRRQNDKNHHHHYHQQSESSGRRRRRRKKYHNNNNCIQHGNCTDRSDDNGSTTTTTTTAPPRWKFWKSVGVFRNRDHLEENIATTTSTTTTPTTTTTTPIWLQDPVDGLCLGPTSYFSECGDATAWYVTIQYDLPPTMSSYVASSSSSSSSSILNHPLELVLSATTLSLDAKTRIHHYYPTQRQQNETNTKYQQQQHLSSSSSLITNAGIGLTFRVIDQDFQLSGAKSTTPATKRRRRRRRRHHDIDNDDDDNNIDASGAECLDADLNNDGDDSNDDDVSVHVRQCRTRGGLFWQSREQKLRSSVWMINQHNILQPYETMTNTKQQQLGKRRQQQRIDDAPQKTLCLTRNSTSNRAILAHCDTDESTTTTTTTVHNNKHERIKNNNSTKNYPVQFVFVRYHAVPTQQGMESQQPQAYSGKQQRHKEQDSTKRSAGLVTANEIPDDATPLLHPELKIASRLIFTELPGSNNAKQQRRKKDTADATGGTKNAAFKPSPFVVALSNTNPLLLVNTKSSSTDGTNTAGKSQKNPSMIHTATSDNTHGATASTSTTNTKISKLRRMQTHPYLNEAKADVWTDPQTNLQYSTDLCHYLGRSRHDHGRHTLTGFGIYRKGYVIKVYGIAYYVSKRDVLMDPVLEPYATMTAEQLRVRPDFYEVLRTMRTSQSDVHSSQRAGYFDRTIMLKTNMQLSTETMRSSLEADWSYLTDEAKRTLVDASMQEQIADDAMLEFIQRSDINPSRCSCSQIAPPEYKSNPDCCARGTELVFTWTKANELEVRLNGRLMDIFPRPDIAEGIFYEYLRIDNPISPEFVDRVVDGFPFLLGPLAQVRGVHIGQSSTAIKGMASENVVVNAMFGFRDFVMSQTMAMADVTKQNMLDAADHAGNMAKLFVDTAMEVAKEADRRRDLMVKHTVAAPEVAMKLLSRDEETIRYFIRWMSGQSLEPEIVVDDRDTDGSTAIPKPRGPRGRTFGYPLSRWFGEDIYHSPDEIEPMMIHPTINRVILTLVHLYLLLLFIVSFPGSYSTRTKILHRRYREPLVMDDSDSDTMSDDDTNSNKLSLLRVVMDDDSNSKNEDHDDDDNAYKYNHRVQHRYNTSMKFPCSTKKILQVSGRNHHNNNGNDNDNRGNTALLLPPRTYLPQRASDSPSSGMKKKSLSYFL